MTQVSNTSWSRQYAEEVGRSIRQMNAYNYNVVAEMFAELNSPNCRKLSPQEINEMFYPRKTSCHKLTLKERT